MTQRIEARFEQCRQEGRAALVTYVMAGDPDPETSLEILKSLPGAGADEALERAQWVSALLHGRYEVEDTSVPLGATIGVATHVWPRSVGDADGAVPTGGPTQSLSALLAAADQAMYHARVLKRRIAVAEELHGGSAERRSPRRPVA